MNLKIAIALVSVFVAGLVIFMMPPASTSKIQSNELPAKPPSRVPDASEPRLLPELKGETAAVRTIEKSNGERYIGAEGYGPHIQSALLSGNAVEAFEAYNWIANCKINEEVLEGMLKLRSQPGAHQKELVQGIELQQIEGRRCQTITPDISALGTQLAFVAMKGRVPGAAFAYAASVKFNPPVEAKPELLSALVYDAKQGNANAVLVLGGGLGGQLGLSDSDARVYEKAMHDLSPRDGFPLSKIPGLSSLGESEADPAIIAAAQKIVMAVRAAKK